MGRKNISREKIIQSFLMSSFNKSAGATSLSDISELLGIKKASLYNHFENKDEMYNAAIEYCGKELGLINFEMEKTFDSIRNSKILPTTLFRRLISRYFNLFETEPLFQIYIFLCTEQYYNDSALEIFVGQKVKLEESIRKIISLFVEVKRMATVTEKEIKDFSLIISMIIISGLDSYLATRKSTIRKNPETGVGCLFALPTDEASVNRTIKIVEYSLKEFFDL